MAPAKSTKMPPRKPLAPAKSPAARKKSQPNASILSYFKKTEESLFLEDGRPVPDLPDDHDDDLYGVENVAPEKRYNEMDTSIKKRKLSSIEDEATEKPGRKASPLDDASRIQVPPPPALGRPSSPPKATASNSPGESAPRKPAKPGFNNPFLDDSDEEDADASTPPSSEPNRSTDDSKDDRSPKPRLERSVFRQGFEDPADLVPDQEALSDDENAAGLLPPPPLEEAETYGDSGDFENFDQELDVDELGGEEYRAMRYMEEQARLEEEAGAYSCDDELAGPVSNDLMAQNCPICDGSLAGTSPSEATEHVNSCLDGNPTPLPSASKAAERATEEEIEGSEMGKRFARAAVPRPGQANPFVLGDSGAAHTGGNSAFSKLMSGHAEDAAWAAAAAAEHSSRGQPAYKRTCPFYKIMPGFFICVDAFRYGAVKDCRAYFLSHFHSDHYIGLTANWTHGPIYCSKVTGSLVKTQLKTAGQYVVELEFEERVSIPGTGAFVTMIPANHCPGSSLFLFEKPIGSRTQRILHCGDFRACPAHAQHPELRPEIIDAVSGRTKQQKIDVCYLDTTYLNPRYSFPPQDDVIRACAEMCVMLNDGLRNGDESRWKSLIRQREAGGSDDVSKFFVGKQQQPEPAATTSRGKAPANEDGPPDAFTALKQRNGNRLLVICGTYSIGKERICKAIALALKTKIFASPAKIRICQQLGDPELAALLTSNPREAQVHMQMLMEIRAETLAEYLAAYRDHFGRIVGFRPSGWNYRPAGGGRSVSASLQPSSLATTQLLHGPAWRTRFAAPHLVPQRGSGKEAICFGVPYSEHSSFRELALFLMALRIDKVVPTVNVGSEQSRKRMKAWIDRWVGDRRKYGLIRLLEEDAGKEEPAAGSASREQAAGAAVLWDGKSAKGGGVYW